MSNHSINSWNPVYLGYLSEGVRKRKPSSESQCGNKVLVSLLLVRGPATNINVCYLSSAKHKLNPPWGHAPAAYRGRWFPYVQYRGSHTRTLFALWRLKVFKIWIEECNDNREPCPGVRRGISKPSLVSALQESFLCRNLIMSFQWKSWGDWNVFKQEIHVLDDWDDRPYSYFFPRWRGAGYKNIIKYKVLI